MKENFIWCVIAGLFILVFYIHITTLKKLSVVNSNIGVLLQCVVVLNEKVDGGIEFDNSK